MNLVVRFETWVNVVGNANTLKRESSRHWRVSYDLDDKPYRNKR